MNRSHTATIAEWLDERDRAILANLDKFRLLSTRHVQQLHFADRSSELAAARAATRTMQRLNDLGVVTALARRIGGARKGSAGYVWQLASSGERFVRSVRGHARRRRYVEPARSSSTTRWPSMTSPSIYSSPAAICRGSWSKNSAPSRRTGAPTSAPEARSGGSSPTCT